MAAIRSDELAYTTRPKLDLIEGELRESSRPWHPSMGPRPKALLRRQAGAATSLAKVVDSSTSTEDHSDSTVPNYKARRALVLVAVALILSLGGAGASWATSSGPAHAKTTTYIVQPGDTLWAIAVSERPNVDPRKTVTEIRSINRIGPDISPGQQIEIPG